MDPPWWITLLSYETSNFSYTRKHGRSMNTRMKLLLTFVCAIHCTLCIRCLWIWIRSDWVVLKPFTWRSGHSLHLYIGCWLGGISSRHVVSWLPLNFVANHIIYFSQVIEVLYRSQRAILNALNQLDIYASLFVSVSSRYLTADLPN